MLLSDANMRGSKAEPMLYLADLARLPESTTLLVMPPRHPDAHYQMHLQTIHQITKGQLFAGICLYRDGADAARCRMLSTSAADLGLRVAAAANVLYHIPARRPLADVLSCIREKQQLDHAGYILSRNAERHLIDCETHTQCEAIRQLIQLAVVLPEGAVPRRRTICVLSSHPCTTAFQPSSPERLLMLS